MDLSSSAARAACRCPATAVSPGALAGGLIAAAVLFADRRGMAARACRTPPPARLARRPPDARSTRPPIRRATPRRAPTRPTGAGHSNCSRKRSRPDGRRRAPGGDVRRGGLGGGGSDTGAIDRARRRKSRPRRAAMTADPVRRGLTSLARVARRTQPRARSSLGVVLVLLVLATLRRLHGARTRRQRWHSRSTLVRPDRAGPVGERLAGHLLPDR